MAATRHSRGAAKRPHSAVVDITGASLRRMPLPKLDGDGDKDARGRVVVIGGSVAMPGAILLAGVAALRAGAGKLQIATVRDVVPALAVAVPEARVIALPVTRTGNIAGASASSVLRPVVQRIDAALVGPGVDGDHGADSLAPLVARRLAPKALLVLDAAGLLALRRDATMLAHLDGRSVITPHAGEMATLLGVDKRDIDAHPGDIALDAASHFETVVVLKGSVSWIASPDGDLFRYRAGSVGLATSGSGDTLAGVVAGLAARCDDPLIAACWAVWAHGTAGNRLAKRVGQVGFLARELLAELPPLLGRA